MGVLHSFVVSGRVVHAPVELAAFGVLSTGDGGLWEMMYRLVRSDGYQITPSLISTLARANRTNRNSGERSLNNLSN